MSGSGTSTPADPRCVAPGLWREIVRPFAGTTGRRALFLDRDGVLNRDTGYVCDPQTLEVWTDAVPLIIAANRSRAPVVIVTNQSGIARGYYDWTDFDAVNRRILGALTAAGAAVDAILACACHAEGKGALAVADHPWRKPQAGMLLEAASFLPIELEASFIVGDREGDMIAAAAAGLKRGLLIFDGDRPGEAEDRRIGGFSYGTCHRQAVDWPALAAATFPLQSPGTAAP